MSDWTANDLYVNGIKVHYARTGGQKPPIVLMHGFSDNGLCWTPIARALEDAYDVIMPDARGHGLSERVTPGSTPDGVADLAGLIQALALDRPAVMGHSMGASTAALVGAQYPDLVGCLILEDPPLRDEEPAPPKQAAGEEKLPPFVQELIKVKSHTREEIMAFCRAKNPTWPEAELEPWADSKLQFDLNVLKMKLPDYTGWREVVSHITCPTLLITADPDRGALVTPEAAQEVVRLLPQCEVAHIAGAGHSIRREQAAAYLEAVARFLREHYR